MLLIRYDVQVDMRNDVSPNSILDDLQTRPCKLHHGYIAMRPAMGLVPGSVLLASDIVVI